MCNLVMAQCYVESMHCNLISGTYVLMDIIAQSELSASGLLGSYRQTLLGTEHS